MPLAPAATLLRRMPEQIATILAAHGTPQTIIDDELQRMREHRVAGKANRSVVGIMNEFTFLAETHRADGSGESDLLNLSLQLATTPCCPLYRKNISLDQRTRRNPALHRHLTTATAIAQHPVARADSKPHQISPETTRATTRTRQKSAGSAKMSMPKRRELQGL